MAQEFLLVDGYNIIFSWPELKKLAEDNLESARIRLADILCNYQGFRKDEVILVFDGYKSKGNPGTVVHYHNIDIVYTREAQTADQFIEAVSYQMALNYQIRVATSDGLEQMIILAKGAVRMSAQELLHEVKSAERAIRETAEATKHTQSSRNSLLDNLSPEMAEFLRQLRLQETPEPEDGGKKQRNNDQKQQNQSKPEQKAGQKVPWKQDRYSKQIVRQTERKKKKR